MKPHVFIISAVFACFAGAAFGQSQSTDRQGEGLQAWQDPREAGVLASCKNPPKPFSLPPAPPEGAAPPPPRKPAVSTAIPGVIAAGQNWKVLWETDGNNADGIVAGDDGGLLIAQNDKSDVIKLDADGNTSVLYMHTHTGGALSRNKNGALFIVERGLNPAIWQLAPERKVLANRYQGEPLDCIGGILNDLTADSKGGVYFTMGGLFYADPDGVITRYGENLRTNGVILSPDERTVYVTNGPTLAAFDVQADGSLTNQRELAKLPSGNGDGMTVDAAGRVYVTAGGNVDVIAPDGTVLGTIPGPEGLISVAFSGPDKNTLYAATLTGFLTPHRHNTIVAIPMVAHGYEGRAK